MKKTINFYDFCDSFTNHDRTNQFSYNGKQALFDYLEAYEEDTQTEIELDIIGLCCEFTEYESISEFQSEYGEEYETIEDIECMTQVIIVSTYTNDNGDDDYNFIIQVF